MSDVVCVHVCVCLTCIWDPISLYLIHILFPFVPSDPWRRGLPLVGLKWYRGGRRRQGSEGKKYVYEIERNWVPYTQTYTSDTHKHAHTHNITHFLSHVHKCTQHTHPYTHTHTCSCSCVRYTPPRLMRVATIQSS